jgi:cytidylate kinase
MNKIIIAIDGWSSCGKSTLARQLAKRLNYIFIDSGAMYRAIALYFIRNNISTVSITEVETALSEISLEFKYNDDSNTNEICLNGENVAHLIRHLDVAEKVSEVAAIEQVRAFAVNEQQKIGKDKGIVMDGRDIGTTVFPHAELKIFMTADKEVRVLRRFKEMAQINPLITENEVRFNLQSRDEVDSTRKISPLRKADDAIVLDNSSLTPEEQLSISLELALAKINS